MSIAYFDASAVVAFLLQQPEGDVTRAIWQDEPKRVSSMLLKAECLVSLRRNAGRIPKGQSREWLHQRLSQMASRMEEISLTDVDESILSVLDREVVLSECRILDALHVATAVAIREKTGESVAMVSLDERMRSTAKLVKLEVLPA